MKKYIKKEEIRGHLRNWIFLHEIPKKKDQTQREYVFDMESIYLDKELEVFVLKKDISIFIQYTFYIDNFMRFWLGRNENKYLEETPKNIKKLMNFFDEVLKDL
jgi:hypothetical protein